MIIINVGVHTCERFRYRNPLSSFWLWDNGSVSDNVCERTAPALSDDKLSKPSPNENSYFYTILKPLLRQEQHRRWNQNGCSDRTVNDYRWVRAAAPSCRRSRSTDIGIIFLTVCCCCFFTASVPSSGARLGESWVKKKKKRQQQSGTMNHLASSIYLLFYLLGLSRSPSLPPPPSVCPSYFRTCFMKPEVGGVGGPLFSFVLDSYWPACPSLRLHHAAVQTSYGSNAYPTCFF